MLPAPGQGALAIECRSGDIELVAALARLDDPATRAAVTAERAVLSTLEAGCSAPLGALAEVVEGEDGEELWLRAVALSEDGGLSVRMSTTGPVAEAERTRNTPRERHARRGSSRPDGSTTSEESARMTRVQTPQASTAPDPGPGLGVVRRQWTR